MPDTHRIISSNTSVTGNLGEWTWATNGDEVSVENPQRLGVFCKSGKNMSSQEEREKLHVRVRERLEEALIAYRENLQYLYTHQQYAYEKRQKELESLYYTIKILTTCANDPFYCTSLNDCWLLADICAYNCLLRTIPNEQQSILMHLYSKYEQYAPLKLDRRHQNKSIGSFYKGKYFTDGYSRVWEIRRFKHRIIEVRASAGNNQSLPNYKTGEFEVSSRGLFNCSSVQPEKFFYSYEDALSEIGYSTCQHCGCQMPIMTHMLYANKPGDKNIYFFCRNRMDCLAAWDEFNEPPEVRSAIKNYQHKPTPKFMSHSDFDTMYLGVEIEVENVGFMDGTPTWKNKRSAYELSKDFQFLYCKSDSSIMNGFEIVTEPMSFEWITHNKDKVAGFMQRIRKMGFRSFEPGTCGMHVHINRNFFNTNRLVNFLRFFYINREAITQLSHRNVQQIQQYADFEVVGKARIDRINLHGQECAISGRHGALNLQNAATVEVRVFRGTLDFNMFLRNIEFVHAASHFCPLDKHVSDMDELSLKRFVDFTCKRKNLYPEFYKYLTVHESEFITE